MAHHTPGPWTIERMPIQSCGGSNTCYKIGPFQACIYDDWRPREVGISENENSANARLIAAAPDLLAACEAAVVWMDAPEWRREKPRILAMANAAIAKANGTS